MTKNKYFFLILFGLFFLAEPVLAEVDTDGDGLSDRQEQEIYFTDPNNPDTDGDSFFDGKEVENDYSPHQGDSARLSQHDYDGDGLSDWLELRWFGSSLGQLDTDGDGMNDFAEVMRGAHPKEFGTSTRFSREIVVDRTTQRLAYFVDGMKIVNYPVSTGNPWTPTPAGDFSIQRKLPFVDYIGADYNYPSTPWNLQFYPRYYIHTAYWHNDFGVRTRSHGCINMKQEDVAVLYEYIDVGVAVTVTGTTPVGRFVR